MLKTNNSMIHISMDFIQLNYIYKLYSLLLKFDFKKPKTYV